jgi:hypothetical protein
MLELVSRRFSDFLMAASFLNSKLIVLASCLQKTGRFARNWRLAREKFAAVLLMDF